MNDLALSLRPRVVLAAEPFGGVVYVPQRDDFFAVDKAVFHFLKLCEGRSWTGARFPGWERLVDVGICIDDTGTRLETAYSGVSFIGEFEELPSISRPLVLNVLVTAKCHLACSYCHADDLMKQYAGEVDTDLVSVISTARGIDSIVAVITGGDPAASPERAIPVIEALAGSRALVLDTSGLGRFDELLPSIQQHNVHVRVSVDSPGPENRPRGRLAFEPSEEAIRKCIDLGVSLTVQSVVSSRNGDRGAWEQTYEWLDGLGVKNWVMHLAIPAGKNRPKSGTARSLVPSDGTRGELKAFAQSFVRGDRSMDLRVTDTAANPNSILLVAGPGDLFTEGYAKRGKVRLFEAQSGRVDQFKALWHFVDQFGHAERYLNYSQWRYGDKNLSDLSLPCGPPGFDVGDDGKPGLVEMESKFAVADVGLARSRMIGGGYTLHRSEFQRDEYYDLVDGSVQAQDYAVRLRTVGDESFFAVKSPRHFQASGSSSRFEFEVPIGDVAAARDSLEAKGMVLTWVLEKQRETWVSGNSTLELDLVPVVGGYLEIEGDPLAIRLGLDLLGTAIGPPETRNYREILVALAEPAVDGAVVGATFDNGLEVLLT